MGTPLRLLILEDNPADVELVLHSLRRAGYDPIASLAETEEDYVEHLRAVPEIILADFNLPQFDSLRALEIMHERRLDIPFIIVSGTIGEERAVQVMQRGATDYVIKDRLGRLGLAVEQALSRRQLKVDKLHVERSAADALRTSEMQFRQLADAMPQIVWTAQPDGTIDYFNDRWYQLCGFSRDADTEHTWRTTLHPDDLQRTQNLWARAIATGSPLELEMRLIDHRTRQARWYLCRAVAATDTAGAVTKWYGTTTDIDEQRQQFEKLQVSEQRFRDLVMALPAAVFTTDQNGLMTLFNEDALELWGRRPDLGRDRWDGAWKTYRPDGTPLAIDQVPIAVMLREGRTVRAEEIIIERPDGTRSQVLSHPEALRGPNGEIVGAVNMLIDISHIKELENQFRQSQKMDAVGQLAAGVAHDFNNLLTVILGYSELFLETLPAVHPDRDLIEPVRDAGRRAAGLTRQLLAVGRKQMMAPTMIDLNALVIELDKMLRRLIGEDIELSTILAPQLNNMKADPGQIEQVLMNLIVNARDAMPTGGRLTIQTQNAELTELQQREHPDLPDCSYTLLSVSDSGTGMDEATLSRIFEPFFTTKDVGKGTGLGLATVFGIVKQTGGFIEVASRPGAGTTFRIYLPQLGETSLPSAPLPMATACSRGMETILLVEDEEELRKLTQTVLEASGYQVLTAHNGSDAVRLCSEYAHEIHLLFTDVVMPKMSGRELVEKVTLARPGIKVLYMSGYTDDTMLRHGIQDAETNFLAKPFTPATMTVKVRGVLDSPPSASSS